MIIEDGRLVSRAFGDGIQPADGGVQQLAEGAAGPGAAANPAALDISGHAAQLADLLAAIDEGRAPAVDGEAGRAALEIVCAVYESSRSGRPVTLRS